MMKTKRYRSGGGLDTWYKDSTTTGGEQSGTPYEAKWLDPNGRMASRMIPRPHMLSEYFKHSNQIDKYNHAR